QDAFLSMRRTCACEAGVHGVVGSDVDLEEAPAELLCQRFALLRIQIEDRDLHAVRGETTGRGGTEPGSAAGDDSGDGGIEFHVCSRFVGKASVSVALVARAFGAIARIRAVGRYAAPSAACGSAIR